MSKFKIGDRVRIIDTEEIGIIIKESFEINKSIYNDDELLNINYFVDISDIGGNPDWVLESELELVETSEEIAVKKFKEELKEKINKLLSKEFIDSLYNDSRQEVTFRVTEKKEEILKLLEE